MGTENSRLKTMLLALALAMGFLTVVPAMSSLLVVTSAWSDRSDVPAVPAGGHSIVFKNGETPQWMVELLEQAPFVEEGLAGTIPPSSEELAI